MHQSKKLKLICVPYAGSSASAFDAWSKLLDTSVEVVKFEYPGRGIRSNDKLSLELDDLVSEVMDMISNCEIPYALFGHSMGAVITYLAAEKARYHGLKKATHLFFSGFQPPHIYFGKTNHTHKLHDAKFIEALREIESLPQALLENPRILKLYLPTIKHDFYLLESYDFQNHDVSLDCKVSVFLGERDPITAGINKEEWKKCSLVECKIYDFEGNHFFIDTCRDDVVNTINIILKMNDLI